VPVSRPELIYLAAKGREQKKIELSSVRKGEGEHVRGAKLELIGVDKGERRE